MLDPDVAAAPTSPTSPAPACAADRTVDLPPEAESIRAEVRAFVTEAKRRSTATPQRDRLIETGYLDAPLARAVRAATPAPSSSS